MARLRPGRFLGVQAVLLAAGGIALLWLFHVHDLDLWLERPYYDPATGTFPWRHAWLTEQLVHRGLTAVLIAAGIGVWAAALAMKTGKWVPRTLAGRQRRWWLVAWSFLCIPLLVDLLRRFSPMHCPWDIDGFGGLSPYVDLLSRAPPGMSPGHCFPAAALTSASWLLSLALLWYPERKLRSAVVAIAALVLALGIGWVQQMRGAHFLSHTLWSLWISWAVIVLLYRFGGACAEAAGTPERH